jgi:hypothetical protein
MKATTVKEVLIATRWIIDNVGWCQYRSFQLEGGNSLDAYWMSIEEVLERGVAACCLGGSIRLVEVADNALIDEARICIEEALNGYVASWNDQPGRTKQEVLDLLDRVIEGES